jgi:choline kinase
MRAIILAAGKGNRLRPFTDHSHKCLLEFEGRTLIQRYLDDLASLGIERATMVIGHQKELVRDHVGEGRPGISIDYLVNPLPHRGSVFTVAMASQHFDDDILMMDCDVLYHPELLRRIVRSENPNCYLMDKGYTETGEECKVAALDGRVVANNREINVPYNEIGEGLGFLKLCHESANRYAEILNDFMQNNNIDCEYEDPLEILIQEHVIGYEPVDDLAWTEIDFAEDIEKARNIILPKIQAST